MLFRRSWSELPCLAMKEKRSAPRCRETEAREAENTSLRALLAQRRAGRFVSQAEGREQTRQMIAEKRAALGLPDGSGP